MLDSIYHRALKLLWHENAKILQYIRDVIIAVNT